MQSAAWAATNPQYVIDFAIPLDIDLSQYIGNKNPVSGSGEYGDVSVNGKVITYTPKKIINGIDTLQIKLSDNSTFNLDIVPASSVYYEEAYAYYFKDAKTVSDYDQLTLKIINGEVSDLPKDYSASHLNGITNNRITTMDAYNLLRQSADLNGQKKIYGYDDKYGAETRGMSNHTESLYCGNTNNDDSGGSFVIPFKGTGIEVRTGILPDGDVTWGTLRRVNEDGSFKSVKVSYMNLQSSNGDTPVTSLQSEGGQGFPFSYMNLPYGQYVLRILVGSDIDTCHGSVHLDGFRVYGALGDEGDAIYAKDNQAHPVYHSIRNNIVQDAISNYEDMEDAIRDEVKDFIRRTVANYTGGFILFSLNGGITEEEMADIINNGPKTEFFLPPGASIVMKVKDYTAIGMNAYNRPVTYEVNDTGVKTMTSNTNLYYQLKPGVNTITNTSKDALLSLTQLRVTTNGDSEPDESVPNMTDEDIEDGIRSLYMVDIEGTVSWKAPDALLRTRPENVTIKLHASNREGVIDEVKLIDGKFSFKNLQKYDDDLNRIEYTITAQDVNGFSMSVNGYDVLYEGDVINPVVNPVTADSIVASCVGGLTLISTALWFGKRILTRR